MPAADKEEELVHPPKASGARSPPIRGPAATAGHGATFPLCRRRLPLPPPLTFIAPPLVPSAQVQVSSSPVYTTGRRLGKGGFGQVFLGTRSQKSRSAKDQKPVEVRSACLPAVYAAKPGGCCYNSTGCLERALSFRQ
jgi:hypothetical protein